MSPTPTGNQTSKIILFHLLHGLVLPFSMTKYSTVIPSLATAEHTPFAGSLTTSLTSDSWSISSAMQNELIFWVPLCAHTGKTDDAWPGSQVLQYKLERMC